MICPQCGYDMGRAHRCLRCGFEIKTLAVVDENDEKKEEHEHKEEEPSTVVIDPRNTYISNPDEDYFDTFDPFDPFGSLFGGMFDPIGDLLGGLFGFDIRGGSRRREEPPEPETKKRRKKGPIVEVNNVEILDADGNPIKEDEPKNDGKKHSSKRDNNRK